MTETANSTRPVRVLLITLTILACASGCYAPQGPARVIVLGFDGMDPRVVDLLLSEGKLASFATLRRLGAYGRLSNREALDRSAAWTTIATGRTVDEHGVVGETHGPRQVDALWNLITRAGRRSAVVGWPATWPAETTAGAIISDRICGRSDAVDGTGGALDLEALVHPPELVSVLAPVVRNPEDVSPELVDHITHSVAKDADTTSADLDEIKNVLASAETCRGIGAYLWAHEQPDLLMVYVDVIGKTVDQFGRPLGGEALESVYEYVDAVIGEFLTVMDDRTALVVLSASSGGDTNAASTDRDDALVGEQGALFLYGYRVRKRTRIGSPNLADVAPTILALSDLEPPPRMLGRILGEVLYVPQSQRRAPRPQFSPDPRAVPLLEGAKEAAGRGDYATAMAKLDEAEQIAPRSGLLYQYRSNVAMLIGDRPAAIAALRKGLEIEPNNQLFRDNLRRLQAPAQ